MNKKENERICIRKERNNIMKRNCYVCRHQNHNNFNIASVQYILLVYEICIAINLTYGRIHNIKCIK